MNNDVVNRAQILCLVIVVANYITLLLPTFKLLLKLLFLFLLLTLFLLKFPLRNYLTIFKNIYSFGKNLRASQR